LPSNFTPSERTLKERRMAEFSVDILKRIPTPVLHDIKNKITAIPEKFLNDVVRV
jgi:hypothetical protein